MAEARCSYTASLTSADRMRRQLLIGDASVAWGAGSPVDNAWSFRTWCESLPFWGNDVLWDWGLEQQRVRATTDLFWYSRPMQDPVPWAHGRSRGPSLAAVPAGVSPLSLGAAYDIGYVAPFLAGRLRRLWAEHASNQMASDSRRVVGSILTSIMCGGVLELLLLTCACSDAVIR